jgi:outer membrane cobalamin receptor
VVLAAEIASMKLATNLFLVICALAQVGFGQQSVSGIAQQSDGQPIEYASVRLMQASDSSLVQGALTEANGTFSIKIAEAGRFYITIERLGFEDTSIDPFDLAEGEQKDIGTLSMTAAAAQTDEVQIVADKPPFEQDIDKMVINVATSPTFTGLNALDILSRSPGVRVDEMNDLIALAGSGGVQIYINGKQTRIPTDAVIALLRGTSGSSIEKIEVYTLPPARFDAEGSGGIINIIMRQNPEEGLNGNYSVFLGHGFGEKAGGSINANYRKGKMNLYGGYSIDHSRTRQFFENRRTVRIDGNETFTEMISTRLPIERANNARLGVDFDISDKTTVGLLVSGYDTWWDMDATNALSLKFNGELQDSLSIPNREINHWQHIMGNVNLAQKIGKSSNLNVDLDYLYFIDNNPTDYDNQFFNGDGELINNQELRSTKNTPIDIMVGKFDFSGSIKDKVQYAFGAKHTTSLFTNALGVDSLLNGIWVPSAEFTNTYELEEFINAAYFTADFSVTKKLKTKLGMRYEHTKVNINDLANSDTIRRNFGQFFPTVFLAYELGENKQVQLSYSRRINRPTFNDLAPFYLFWDPFTLFTGNPNLLPTISSRLRLNYNVKQLFVSAGVERVQNAIAGFQPTIVPEKNQQFLGPSNIDRVSVVGGSISYPVKIGKAYTIRTNLDAFYRLIEDDYQGVPQEIDQFGMFTHIQQQLKLPKDWTFEATFMFQSPWQFGINRSKIWAPLSLGIQKRFKNESRISISWDDIFWGRQWRWTSVEPAANLDVSSAWKQEPRVLRISYSHSFGRETVKRARDRQTGSAEEQGRVN